MLHTLRFSPQNAVYFIMLHFLVPVLFIFYVQDVLKFKFKTPGAKRLSSSSCLRLLPRLPVTSVLPSICPSAHQRGGRGITSHILKAALAGGEWSASRPGRFIPPSPRWRASGTRWRLDGSQSLYRRCLCSRLCSFICCMPVIFVKDHSW
jgi:hypothetical protein